MRLSPGAPCRRRAGRTRRRAEGCAGSTRRRAEGRADSTRRETGARVFGRRSRGRRAASRARPARQRRGHVRALSTDEPGALLATRGARHRSAGPGRRGVLPMSRSTGVGRLRGRRRRAARRSFSHPTQPADCGDDGLRLALVLAARAVAARDRSAEHRLAGRRRAAHRRRGAHSVEGRRRIRRARSRRVGLREGRLRAAGATSDAALHAASAMGSPGIGSVRGRRARFVPAAGRRRGGVGRRRDPRTSRQACDARARRSGTGLRPRGGRSDVSPVGWGDPRGGRARDRRARRSRPERTTYVGAARRARRRGRRRFGGRLGRASPRRPFSTTPRPDRRTSRGSRGASSSRRARRSSSPDWPFAKR